MTANSGFDMLDMSSVPPGAGLSSSAAIELSSGYAMSALYGFDVDKKTLVRIGRQSENLFVGMPCGILDQGVSGYGKADSLVFIDCLTEEFSNFPLPHKCRFWLFNSTKKHALVDGLYAERHAECMEAAKILSEGGKMRLLRHFTISDLEAAKSKMTQKVYNRAKHVIEENERVLKAKDLLLRGDITGVGSSSTPPTKALRRSLKTPAKNSTSSSTPYQALRAYMAQGSQAAASAEQSWRSQTTLSARHRQTKCRKSTPRNLANSQ